MKSAVKTLVILFVCFASACGVVMMPDTSADADVPADAPLPDASLPDAAVDAGDGLYGCTWGEPVALTELNTGLWEGSPTITADENYIIFARADGDLPSDASLWEAHRVGEDWQAPSELTELDVPGWSEGTPSVSSDGLELYYGANGRKRGVRQSFDEPFQIEELAFSGYGMEVSRDGFTLYYYSPPSLRSRERVTFAGDWGEERFEIREIDDSRYGPRFTVSADQLVIVAVSKGLPMRVYHRAAVDDPWLGPVTMDALTNFTDCAFGNDVLYCSRSPEDDLYRLDFQCSY